MEKQNKSNNLTTAINLFIADIEKINKRNVERLKIKFNHSIDENLESGRFIFDLKNAFGDEVLKIQETLNQLIKERVINGFMSFSKNKAKILLWLWHNSQPDATPDATPDAQSDADADAQSDADADALFNELEQKQADARRAADADADADGRRQAEADADAQSDADADATPDATPEPQSKTKTIVCFNCGAENTIRF